MSRLLLTSVALVAAAVAAGACTRDLVVLRPLFDADASSSDAAGSDAGHVDGGVAEDPGDADLPSPMPTTVAAFDHTCAVSEGRLFCWGENARLQLGLGDDRAPRRAPVQVSEHQDYVEACAGELHSCALRLDGSLSCWGENVRGELGVGDLSPRATPAEVPGHRFVRVACGGFNTCGLTAEGALYCWGENAEGQLGQGDLFSARERAVPTRVAPGRAFQDVSLGQGHVCAAERDGALFCWGRNNLRQLGGATELDHVRSPVRVDPARSYRRVSAGQTHTCGITRRGELYCWGIPHADRDHSSPPSRQEPLPPTRIGSHSDYLEVRAAWFHTCALRAGGRLACWGRNVEGQLGVADYVDRSAPTEVALEAEWSGFTVGRFHTCGFRAAGTLYCWGENDERGQLGIDADGRRNAPTAVNLASY